MITLQNLHTHCTWCDGRDSVREMIEHAIGQGFDSIGFSAHSPMSYSSCGMDPEKVTLYVTEVRAMAEEYRDRIRIFCGLEQDLFSGGDLSQFDYVIGSVHYFRIDGEYVGFDRNLQTVKGVIDTYFGGDGMRYAKAYYETLPMLCDIKEVNIVGHLDLITKHADSACLFDTESAEYRRYATEAIEALVQKIPLFEINTGAISRGYRKTPYPDPFLLRQIRARGGEILISSDCHDGRFLSQGFLDAAELAIACGFTHTQVLTESGFASVALDDLKRRLVK